RCAHSILSWYLLYGCYLYSSLLSDNVCIIFIYINAGCVGDILWRYSAICIWYWHFFTIALSDFFNLVFWCKWRNLKKWQENRSYCSKSSWCLAHCNRLF